MRRSAWLIPAAVLALAASGCGPGPAAAPAAGAPRTAAGVAAPAPPPAAPRPAGGAGEVAAAGPAALPPQAQVGLQEAVRLEAMARRALADVAQAADPVAAAGGARIQVSGLRAELSRLTAPLPQPVQAAVAPRAEFLAAAEGLLAAGAALDETALARALAAVADRPEGKAAGARLQAAVAASLERLRGRYLQPLPAEKVAYLTFDDGPDPEATPRVLAALAAAGVKATFFVIGQRAEAHPDLVQAIAGAGHTVGNHTYSHHYPDIYAGPEAFMASVEKSRALIERLTGQDGRAVRAPGGSYNKFDRRYFHLLEAGGYVAYDWTVDSEDAKGAAAAAVLANVQKQAAGQSPTVVLMHDSRGKEATIAALPDVIAHLRAQGYRFAALAAGGPGLAQAARRVLP